VEEVDILEEPLMNCDPLPTGLALFEEGSEVGTNHRECDPDWRRQTITPGHPSNSLGGACDGRNSIQRSSRRNLQSNMLYLPNRCRVFSSQRGHSVPVRTTAIR